MILGPVSYLDCAVFCILLAPQLVRHAGILETIVCVVQALPFLLWELPSRVLYERLLAAPQKRTPFVRRSNLFEDVVIRCVRYSFANIPPRIGRVFLSKPVALPFLRYRMLRHGYTTCPVHWHEHQDKDFRGLWIVRERARKPDIVLYYIHGGGFGMGSPYFYLEFLLCWVSVLARSGYRNPVIFALEYTLVPDASFPTQMRQTVCGYRHVLATAGDPSIVCVCGDSAGGTLILALLLYVARQSRELGDDIRNASNRAGKRKTKNKPALAVLLSPWVTLAACEYNNAGGDYLDAVTLERYGLRYAGNRQLLGHPFVSPGSCRDVSWWNEASPTKGMLFSFGQAEVLASGIRELITVLEKAEVTVGVEEEAGGIHVWPVVSAYISSSAKQRVAGIESLAEKIRERVSGKDA